MAGFTIANAQQILEAFFKQSALSTDSTLYVGLCTSAPNDDGTGIAEVTYAEYARQAIAAATDWGSASAAEPSVLANAVAITFPVSVSDSGETATHFILMDSLTLSGPGNLQFSGAVVVPGGGLYIGAGVEPQLDIGALRCTLD